MGCGINIQDGVPSMSETLQAAYDLSAGADPSILLNAAGSTFSLQGAAAVPNTFQIDDAGGADVFAISLAGDLTMAGTFTAGGATLGLAGSLSALTASGWLQVYDTNTDTNDKIMRQGVPAHVNAQIPFLGLFLHSRAIANRVWLGGGSGVGQAATEINFMVAAAVNTATGTQEMQLTSAGLDVTDDIDLGGDLTLTGATGNGDLTMAGQLSVGGAGVVGAGIAAQFMAANGIITASNSYTTAVDKNGRFGAPARVTAQIPFLGMYCQAQAAANLAHWGGGTGFGQAATEHRWYAAAAVNTGTGTQEMSLTNAGLDVVDDVTLGGDLLLDGATGNGDLVMAGQATVQGAGILMTLATAFMRMGDGTAGTDFEMRKQTADTSTMRFAVGSTLNMRIVHDGNEDFAFEAYDGIPALTSTTYWRNADGDWEFPNNVDLDGDLTMDGSAGNGDLTMAGEFTGSGATNLFDNANAFVGLGDSSGSPNFELSKAAAGTSAIRFTAAGDIRSRIQHNSGEDLIFEQYDAVPALVATTYYRNAAGDWEFPNDVLVANDLEIDGELNHDGNRVGFYGTAPTAQSGAYTLNATVVPDRTLLASASATTTNNNNVLAALIADLQLTGIIA